MNSPPRQIANRIALILMLMLPSSLVQGQQTDTLSIYFEFGEHRIHNDQLRRINAIPRVIYTNDLDSVHFIGMADSVGSLKDNLKLGRKRAVEVSKNVNPFLQTSPPYRIFSKGEQSGNAEESRRVDVIFFSPPAQDSVLKDTMDCLPYDVEYCLRRADTLLHRSHVYMEKSTSNSRRRRRGKRYVVVETNYVELTKDSVFYSARRTKTKRGDDTLIIYPVKWHVGRTYGVGYQKRDMYTRIDQADYNEFEIFTLDTGECGDCGYSITAYESKYRSNLEKCRLADRFLMNHLEVKRKRMVSNSATVRVPRTYVDRSTRYYVGYSGRSPIKWRETSGKRGVRKYFSRLFRGKNGKKYYYTDLPVRNNNCLQNIFRDFRCCPEIPDDPGEHENICEINTIRCGYRYLGGGHHPYFGLSYTRVDKENLFVPHFGMERLHHSGFRYGAQLGLTQDLQPVGQVAVGLDYLTIPNYRGGSSQWTSVGDMPRVRGFYSLYLGSSLTGFRNDEKVQYLNQFSYLGFTYYNLKRSGFTKPYLQIGARTDYLNSSSSIRPQVEFGVRWGWR